jgi:uncharacterized protein YbaP (TraB family)
LSIIGTLINALGGDREANELRARLEESEKKIEKLTEMVNILATFDEQMAKDIRTIASHVALMEMSMVDKRKASMVSFRKKPNDDSIN